MCAEVSVSVGAASWLGHPGSESPSVCASVWPSALSRGVGGMLEEYRDMIKPQIQFQSSALGGKPGH